MLPTKAYLKNPATSVAVKYVHTSTNKIKHPVNVVKVWLLVDAINVIVDTRRTTSFDGVK